MKAQTKISVTHVMQQSVSLNCGASSEVLKGLLYPLGEVGIIGFLLRRLKRSRRPLIFIYIFIYYNIV